MEKKELYDSLICALSHDLEACETCHLCKPDAKNCGEIRTYLIQQLSEYTGCPVPRQEKTEKIDSHVPTQEEREAFWEER